MKSYTIIIINLKSFFISFILSILICLIISSILLFFGVNWIIYIVVATGLMFLMSNFLEKKASKTIEIEFDDTGITYYDEKKQKIFNTDLEKIKTYRVKYQSLNFPSFKVTTSDNVKFKFNCKDKPDENFVDFINEFSDVMDRKGIEGRIK